MALYGNALPDFPWDSLRETRDQAARYYAGEVDLTIGSPVDPVPEVALAALAEAANAHAYPAAIGSREMRLAIRAWLRTHRSCTADIDLLPALGEKELVAMLPALLGLGAGDIVAFPEVAYPTYDVGARLAGARPLPLDVESDPSLWPAGIKLLWLNSPSNPTGRVLNTQQLRRIVTWARRTGAIVASDECYAALTWTDAQAPSLLDDAVTDRDATGLLMLYSLSKQSNVAGYRAAFIAGDAHILAPIREIRKHSGMMMPGPVQHVMAKVLADTEHVERQKHIYARRRELLVEALPEAGLMNDPQNVAGLYLWVRAQDERSDVGAWELVQAFAQIGVIVAPGTFYGVNEQARRSVRLSLTASDTDIRDAARRLRTQFRMPS
ncbi:MAG: succinyldiaminopimelate transaminase [Actinomycetaceae bacterium]|nr:succinyldiaminopimelate transaminase [Arcanobacterium sp.]MDD7687155.1 succinyldiaminopimelate transaminase [Actinomycetaceae bacterium]MDY5273898.1 succinyldiaminopimelate transaminase [Arcanobacterium sp.]